jgi:hypothetical protein
MKSTYLSLHKRQCPFIMNEVLWGPFGLFEVLNGPGPVKDF